MTELPALVKAAAAVTALLTVSYAASVAADPGGGTEVLGSGNGVAEQAAGGYGREPLPPHLAVRRGSGVLDLVLDDADGASPEAAPAPILVSARTGPGEAATAVPETAPASAVGAEPPPAPETAPAPAPGSAPEPTTSARPDPPVTDKPAQGSGGSRPHRGKAKGHHQGHCGGAGSAGARGRGASAGNPGGGRSSDEDAGGRGKTRHTGDRGNGGHRRGPR